VRRSPHSNEEVSAVEASEESAAPEPLPGRCKDWKALQTAEGKLMVRGWCTFPSSGWSMDLKPKEPQGVNPADLLLERSVALAAGYQANVVKAIEVHYEQQTDGQYETVTILPDGPTIAVIKQRS